MYDPVIGRWMRTDPAGQFNSPYEGMGNNPVSGTDPTGGEEDGWYTNSSGKAVFDASINSQQDLTNAGIAGSYVGQTISGYDASAGHWFSGDAQGNLSISLPTVMVSAQAAPKFDGSLLWTSQENNWVFSNIYLNGALAALPIGELAGAAVRGISSLALKGVPAAGRVFWSGGGVNIAGKAAAEFAASNGLKTLEMTGLGKTLTAVDKLSPNIRPLTSPLWKAASNSFAEGAEGYAHFFEGPNLNPGGIWNIIEKPILDVHGVTIIPH